MTDDRRRLHQAYSWLSYARMKMQEIAKGEGGGHLVAAAWLRDFANDLHVAGIRESGGWPPSAVCPECQQSPCIGHPRAAERPLLNKSGGSDVEGK